MLLHSTLCTLKGLSSWRRSLRALCSLCDLSKDRVYIVCGFGNPLIFIACAAQAMKYEKECERHTLWPRNLLPKHHTYQESLASEIAMAHSTNSSPTLQHTNTANTSQQPNRDNSSSSSSSS